ncbi:MAG: hypothetical protein M3R01_09455, partial [Actinomycetota bacterium]|nr:hypothetical protein [Actinomycetota bacterium]
GGTYLDLVMALLASACAAARQGQRDEALAPLDEVTALLLPTDDRLTPAVVSLARARVLEALGSDTARSDLAAAESALAALGLDASGWDTAFRLATGVIIPA